MSMRGCEGAGVVRGCGCGKGRGAGLRVRREAWCGAGGRTPSRAWGHARARGLGAVLASGGRAAARGAGVRGGGGGDKKLRFEF